MRSTLRPNHALQRTRGYGARSSNQRWPRAAERERWVCSVCARVALADNCAFAAPEVPSENREHLARKTLISFRLRKLRTSQTPNERCRPATTWLLFPIQSGRGPLTSIVGRQQCAHRHRRDDQNRSIRRSWPALFEAEAAGIRGALKWALHQYLALRQSQSPARAHR